MAQEKVVLTKLYAPDGTLVEVSGEGRATELKENRGYTTSKPRNPKGPAAPYQPEADAKLADLQAQLDEANAKLAAAEAPVFADPKK